MITATTEGTKEEILKHAESSRVRRVWSETNISGLAADYATLSCSSDIFFRVVRTRALSEMRKQKVDK